MKWESFPASCHFRKFRMASGVAAPPYEARPPSRHPRNAAHPQHSTAQGLCACVCVCVISYWQFQGPSRSSVLALGSGRKLCFLAGWEATRVGRSQPVLGKATCVSLCRDGGFLWRSCANRTSDFSRPVSVFGAFLVIISHDSWQLAEARFAHQESGDGL